MKRPFGVVVMVLAAGCGGSAESEPSSPRPTEACSEPAPTEARIAFGEGEIGAMAAANGRLYVGARSIRVGEEGAVWQVPFDGPAAHISSRYIGGPVELTAGMLLHAEPIDEQLANLVVRDLAGAQREVITGPRMIFGEFVLVRDQAFFFGRSSDDEVVGLWSYDRDAGVARIADATGGGLLTNGEDLFQAVIEAAPTPSVAHVKRFDRSRRVFVEVTTFTAHVETVAGADRQSIYLYDSETRRIRAISLASGAETGTLGHDLDGTLMGMHVTGDAIYAVESGSHRLVRVDTMTGEQEVVGDLGESAFVHTFASDACYVYAAIEGQRVAARFPRRPR